MIISNSLYDNATFLKIVNEFVSLQHKRGLIQAAWHVLIKNMGLKIE